MKQKHKQNKKDFVKSSHIIKWICSVLKIFLILFPLADKDFVGKGWGLLVEFKSPLFHSFDRMDN